MASRFVLWLTAFCHHRVRKAAIQRSDCRSYLARRRKSFAAHAPRTPHFSV